MIFSALAIFFTKYKKETYNFNLKSRETFILANNWFMVFFLVTVLIGTLYPIFLDVLINIKISVGAPFYNIVIIPLVVPLLFLMAVGPKVSWINSQNKVFNKFLFFILGALIINFFIIYFSKKNSILSNLIFIAAIFLILHSFQDIKKLINKKNKTELSRVISHLGFGLLIFFIGINHQFSLEEDFNLKVGETKKINNYEIDFESLKTKESKNYKAVIGNFKLTNLKDNQVQYLDPEIRIYSNPETLTYEAAIKTKITSDFYLTMSNVSRSDYYNIKFQNKPFMIWIWISAIMIALGGFVQLTSKKNEN
jgi:cytochrome c-type biogenesis protein CcmF